MKPSNTIISLFKLFFKKKKGGFSDLEVGFLPVVLELSSLPVFLVCDRTVVKSLAFYYKERIGVDVACVSKGLVDSPVGFVGFYDNLFKTSINFIGSSSKVQIYVVDKDLLNESLFEEPLLKGFFINSFIKYDELLSVLGKFNYVISNSLDVDGSYCVRGGVVDIRPVGGVACFRISFLQEVVFLYRLSNHFKIQGVVSEIVLNRIDFKKKHTIFKSLPKKHHYLNYVEGELFFNDNKNGSMVNFFSCVVDYQYYIKNRGSLVVVENSLLKDVGYLINNEFLFVPLWFSSGQKAPRSQARNIAEFVVGSFYVYSAFGICQFLGLEDGGDSNERACFKFLDGVIRLSPSLLGSVFFYSHDIGNSSLSSISKKTTWSRACSQARQKALSYVEDLVVYYKNRKKSFRAPYSLNQGLLDEFVSSFKFEDTEDQKESWLDVLGDMLSNVPMNRLLCGDVGFGKTEIAIRSSFVASFSSRKTIIISPTTVLSEQLYSCFYSRLSGFGVSVKKYFRGNQKKETLEAFVSGGVDVLISTHSILYKKEALAVCSLFIVDEEHRFGVKDKELIFECAPSVDYLSLSATPIPRTMQMALVDIKNVSMLQSPPFSRKPIISQLSYYDFDLVVKVLFEELNRGGQVYFVDNSVDNIVFLFNKFVSLFPGVAFSKIFGSLPSKENKKTMSLFRQKKISVLFATTIIESGVDISSVNTIIINNSHMFGLSQLYQLRGRVGRSSVQSFCYFLIPKNYRLSSSARKRLSSILKYRSLGSGYNLALSDLDTRGFGSLFGYGQSGPIGVGYEMYIKIIGEVLSEAQGLPLVSFSDVSVSRGYICNNFISSDSLRAYYYREIFSSINKKSLLEIKKNIVNSFGFCHAGVLFLLKDRLLSFRAARAGIKSISVVDKKLLFVFCSDFYAGRAPFLFSVLGGVCNNCSIKYVFKSAKKSLNLECVLVDRDTFSFAKKIIRAVLK